MIKRAKRINELSVKLAEEAYKAYTGKKDYKRALELKSELQTLKYNLSCLNVNYASPEGRKLKRQLSKHEQGERILTDTELEQIKSRLAEIPETVIGSKLYGRPLSSEECIILNELRKKTGGGENN